MSPDGRWALFTSNWEKTLGTDPNGEAGGKNRQDVFLVELASETAPAPAAKLPPSNTRKSPLATTNTIVKAPGR